MKSLKGWSHVTVFVNWEENMVVELPICNSVKKILSGQKVDKIIAHLLSRPLQFEK